jgi:hypothetical protein
MRVWLLCQFANSLPLSSKIWALRSKIIILKHVVGAEHSLLVGFGCAFTPVRCVHRSFQTLFTKNRALRAFTLSQT